jgi:hypothetical protein
MVKLAPKCEVSRVAEPLHKLSSTNHHRSPFAEFVYVLLLVVLPNKQLQTNIRAHVCQKFRYVTPKIAISKLGAKSQLISSIKGHVMMTRTIATTRIKPTTVATAVGIEPGL